jgi:predicted adenine nucleotide alpha hydrolase (AANH) superfamily ATPase
MLKKKNYRKILEQTLSNPDTYGKRLLLHSCCAPCSSYVLVYLSRYFEITVFYYNPNITEHEEYQKRVAEQKRLIEELNKERAAGEDRFPIHVTEGDYEPELFCAMAKGREEDPEGGERCFACYALRLKKTAETAAEGAFDYFTTTLTISPLKNADKLNEIGQKLGESCGVPYLLSDFKKNNGYLTSIELSKKYHLYRQDYCGCVYSKQEREKQKKARSEEET